MLEDTGSGNSINIGENVVLRGYVRGNNNKITISPAIRNSIISLSLNGNNNEINIGRMMHARNLEVAIGCHVPAHKVQLEIGDNFSVEVNSRFLLYTSGSALKIGQDCMLSSNVTIRCGESPHLIFNNETGEYLDVSGSVIIGNHVWIGENSYLTKSAGLSNETIVGACAVVTKKFTEPHIAVAGNPAKIVRTNVRWIRNWGSLQEGTKYKSSHDEFHNSFK